MLFIPLTGTDTDEVQEAEQYGQHCFPILYLVLVAKYLYALRHSKYILFSEPL
jgi:hypothetical protein